MQKIYFKDIIGEAFQILLGNTNEKYISFYDLERYGIEVMKIMNDNGKYSSLTLDKKSIEQFLLDHNKIFEGDFINGNYGVRVKSNDKEYVMNYISSKITQTVPEDIINAAWSEKSVDNLLSLVKKEENSFCLKKEIKR